MIKLPPRGTEEGAETRLLLAECRGPSLPGYTIIDATRCMQLMDRVLWNRVAHPKPFLATSGTLLAVITARGQFQGFQHYPNYDTAIVRNLQAMVDIANNQRDTRSPAFATFIGTAIQIAGAKTIDDPSPGILSAWRTAGSGSPGTEFIRFSTVLGTDFYYLPKTFFTPGP